MSIFKQSDYDRIVRDLGNRFKSQPDSRCASSDEVEIALLITGIDELRSIIEEINNWAVCAGIATSEDMMNNIERIIRITSPEYYKN